ncbi:hypothetical protein [Exiguobacterium sp. SRB7LM]|uniref:hypothetical protein n=1 Tax=Exiguobacterium sp. SRB7LM TaxID=2608401 RepID=UPI0018C3E293|nr:hypothetical protein [Exiguobacterium sp. SRB7LM]MBG0917011.1 hypothetical protein [Exiguobacterium sp. SRB7LM]
MRQNILKELIPFYFRQMSRNVFYLIALIFIPIVLIFKIVANVNDPFEYMMFPDVLEGIVIPIQGVMLIVSVVMYRLTSDEAQYRSQLTLPNIVWIQFQKIVAILFIHTFFSFCAILLGLLPVVTYFSFNQIETWSFYQQLLFHSLTFYLLPLLIASVWGINVGLLFGKKRSGILVLFILWILFGPLNTEIFSEFFLEKGFNSPNAFFFFGPLQPEVIYYELTGFLSSNALFIKNMLILCFHFGLTLWIISCWAIRRSHRIQMTVLAIMLFLVIASSASFALSHDQLVFDRSLDTETTKHYELPYPYDFSQIDSLLNFEIINVQLKLAKQSHGQFEVEADYTLVSSTETIVLSLYHPYEVKHISVNQREVSFHQVGDFIEIEAVTLGVPTALSVRYTIPNTSQFPITNEVTYLPAWLNWYPTKQSYPNSRLGSENFKPVINRTNSLPVTLHYSPQSKFLTNLIEQAPAHYEGVQAGVTLFEGSFEAYQAEDQEIIVDQSWTPPYSYWPILKETLQSIHELTEREFGISSSLPDKIILLSPNLEKFSYRDNQHLLLHVGSNLRLDHDLPEVVRAYMPALFWSHSNTDSQIQPTRAAFDDAMAFWLSVELNLPSPLEPDPFFLESILNGEELRTSKKQISEFMQLTHQQQLIFLKKWYRDLNSASKV